MKQYISGALIDNLSKIFLDKRREENFKHLSKWASHFTLKSKSGFEDNNNQSHSSEIAVLVNILQRGIPTSLSFFALDFIVNKTNKCKLEEIDGEIVVNFLNFTKTDIELIFKSLHLIDPRIDNIKQKENYNISGIYYGSEFEEDFIFNTLPKLLEKKGDALGQIFTDQRLITNIINDKKDVEKFDFKIKNNFSEQRTDFSIEFPYKDENKPIGIIVEIDGTQHQENTEQVYLDIERDKVVVECGWHNTLRIKTTDFNNSSIVDKIKRILIPSINNEYINTCIDNFINPIWEVENGKEILQISLIPFAISRIQRTLLEAIGHQRLDSTLPKWKIAIIERDVPCGELAILDLNNTIANLNSILKEKINIPAIEISIFATQEFIESQFRISKALLIEDFNSQEYYDLIIDISILDKGSRQSFVSNNSNELINIRSINYFETKRKIETSDLITYNHFCKLENDSGKWKIEDQNATNALEYFLKSIFRKVELKAGQLPIINNALQCKNVIGLLPTGGGKSLTYQLSAILQPGLCIIIDPIRSLMTDQVYGLNKNNIDSCMFLNSNVKGEAKRDAMNKLKDGEIQFLFISPERLQMEDFRIVLSDLHTNGIYFSYCVIDEAHCVSEWGHDFRTAYLRLGENAIRFCKTKNFDNLPLLGLTATASYDVLADVQRELSGNNDKRKLTEENIVRAEYTKRNELQYIVEDVSFPELGINNIWDLKRELGQKKQERAKYLINDITNHIKEFSSSPLKVFTQDEINTNNYNETDQFEKFKLNNINPNDFIINKQAGIIFCPHTKGIFGVTDKFTQSKKGLEITRKGYYDEFSSLEGINATYFMGGDNDSNENQDDFIKNKSNLMVATKAFGMGIDKKNVRYTIHVNYPGSIESYVQEAGRSGRDRKLALSYILYNDQIPFVQSENSNIDHDFEINTYFHNNSFKGVEKELAVLDELLTEIHFPDRTFEIENYLNNNLNEDIKCIFWEKESFKGIFFNKGFSQKLGFINLITLKGNPKDTIDPELSSLVFDLVINYLNSLSIKEPIHLWLQKSDKQVGIEQVLKSKKIGDSFSIVVGFNNDHRQRIGTLTKWLHDVIHNEFNEQVVLSLRSNCNDADAFIEKVCEKYTDFTNGNKLDFKKVCDERDLKKGKLKGNAIKLFMALYNGYRDKPDTEKAIYRLSTLGIIDDYLVNFSANTFTIKGTKRPDSEYTENLKRYLLKYYSQKTTDIKLKELFKDHKTPVIRRDLEFLISFVYENIRNKRNQAMKDMKNACRSTLDKGEDGSLWLKEYIDLYFNSKYARSEYRYEKNGEIIHASLSDITDNGRKDEIDFVWFFIKVVQEDESGGSEIDNIKHLRGACVRMTSSITEPSFSIKMLSAFSQYMLESTSLRYLKEAEELLFEAFSIIQEKKSKLSENTLEMIYKKFVHEVLENNPQLINSMKEFNLEFDFDSIMIGRMLNPLKNITENLTLLNDKLNNNG